MKSDPRSNPVLGDLTRPISVSSEHVAAVVDDVEGGVHESNGGRLVHESHGTRECTGKESIVVRDQRDELGVGAVATPG